MVFVNKYFILLSIFFVVEYCASYSYGVRNLMHYTSDFRFVIIVINILLLMGWLFCTEFRCIFIIPLSMLFFVFVMIICLGGMINSGTTKPNNFFNPESSHRAKSHKNFDHNDIRLNDLFESNWAQFKAFVLEDL